MILLTGGGWCADDLECLELTKGPMGSSKFFLPGRGEEGILDPDCDRNPVFCNFNRVSVPYCDGTSFSGNLDEPLRWKSEGGEEHSIYFRGRRILDAVVDTLLE